MLSIAVKGAKEVIKLIQKDAKQYRYAVAVGLTKTAVIAKGEVQKEMGRGSVFKVPKPFTLKSGFIKPARRDNLEALVGIKPIAAQYLIHHTERMDRDTKGAERYLMARGILPRSMYIVPGAGARLNRYGNMTKGAITKILQGVSSKGGRYYHAVIQGTPGIWQKVGRKGRRAKPVLIFIKKPKYKKRFDFYSVTQRAFDRHFSKQFDKALDQARSTAR